MAFWIIVVYLQAYGVVGDAVNRIFEGTKIAMNQLSHRRPSGYRTTTLLERPQKNPQGDAGRRNHGPDFNFSAFYAYAHPCLSAPGQTAPLSQERARLPAALYS